MKYIGTKLIEAVPARYISDEKQGAILAEGEKPKAWMEELLKNPEKRVREGYKVTYPDGYSSFSPKDVFEKAYLPMIVNPELKTDKPSVSQEMVDDFILETWTSTLGEKTTVVRAVLRNGFEIVESSACVSKENYDEGYGAEICMEKIRDRVWYLLGFLLQTAVHGVGGPIEPGETVDGTKEDPDAYLTREV